MPIEFTVDHDHTVFGDDGEEQLVGTVNFTVQTRPGDFAVRVLGGGTLRTIALPRRTAYLGVNGHLYKDSTSVEPFRLPANDPAFNLDHITYRADFDLTTLDGTPVPVPHTYFPAPNTDTTVYLTKYIRDPDQTVMVVRARGYAEDVIDATPEGIQMLTGSLAEIADAIGLTAAVDALRDELRAGAPITLNTFVELAAAIGNDPAFATTMNNALALKLNAALRNAANGFLGLDANGKASADYLIDGTANKAYTAAEKTRLAGTVQKADTTTAAMSFVVNEADMVSNSATKVPTQASVRSYVLAKLSELIGAAPAELDTWMELVAAIQNNQSALAGINSAISGKQDLDATLTALAAITTAADRLIYATGADAFAVTTFTALARTLLAGSTAASMQSTLSVPPTSRAINAQHSITGGGNLTGDRTLNLVGDVAAPGNTKLYGTDSAGNRGWFDQPTPAAVGSLGGKLSARPAAGTANRLYFCTDNGNVYRDNGSQWDLVQLGSPRVASPTAGVWSTVNLGTATFVEDTDTVVLTAPSGGSTNSMRQRVKTLPLTSNFVLTAYIDPESIPLLNYWELGILLRNSTSGATILFGWRYDGSPRLTVSKYTSATAFNSAYATPVVTSFPNWLRIVDNGTNRLFQYSPNGVSQWTTIVTASRTDFVTADQVGFGADPYSQPVSARLRSLDVSA